MYIISACPRATRAGQKYFMHQSNLACLQGWEQHQKTYRRRRIHSLERLAASDFKLLLLVTARLASAFDYLLWVAALRSH
jgi:hypothetical protein